MAVSFCLIFLSHSNDSAFNYSDGGSFNRAEWNRKDIYYHDRKLVVNDLMKNHLPQGMHYREVTDLLGEGKTYFPYNDSTDFALSYEIEVLHRRADIDPYDMVFLHIIFSAADSLLIGSELK
jgi:dihydrofolate reductase